MHNTSIDELIVITLALVVFGLALVLVQLERLLNRPLLVLVLV